MELPAVDAFEVIPGFGISAQVEGQRIQMGASRYMLREHIDIKALEEKGAQVLSCGTCLDYYHLSDKLRVGRVSNMFEIMSVLASADRLVRP